MILLIDNHDSFTYNIVQSLRIQGAQVVVRRNDEITLEEVEAMRPNRIVISPGPGGPEKAGVSVGIIQKFAGRIPIFGVCLGMQCIAAAFGGEIVRCRKIFHGKTDQIHHDRRGVFRGVEEPTVQTRYHSLEVERKSLPDCLEITAEGSDGTIMGVRHLTLPVEGVQFHPESIASSGGDAILANLLSDRWDKTIEIALNRLIQGESLSEGDAEEVMEAIADGRVSPVRTGALLCLLRSKGEVVEEISGFARVMRRRMISVAAPEGLPLVDSCGTGGDGSGTFNISTAAALVAAAAGTSIAKHGNRSISSRCGSADVLEALGVPLEFDPESSVERLKRDRFLFLFAPAIHPAMKNVVPVRRELGIRTVFNLLGPLTNPAGALHQVIGVYSEEWTEPIATVLGQLGSKCALVVHGADGLDEITLTGTTKISELRDGWVRTYHFHPREVGFECCTGEELRGGTPEENAEIIRGVLNGKSGPPRDITVLNAGAVIYAGGGAESIAEGVERAQRSIDSGEAAELLERITRRA